jgi:competence protein CoiA
MQFALVDGIRSSPRRGTRGACEACGSPTISKCGGKIVHHWAHASRQSCDPWWENETPWHREWKERFPPECRERCLTAANGEIHRADVITASGIVIEIQNSPMPDAERRSREAFYGNMIWILNGAKFRARFHILHALPDPSSALAQDLVWFKARANERGTSAGLFWRRSENPCGERGPLDMVRVRGMHEIHDEVVEQYRGYHQFDWIKPRSDWLEAACPVFIDFGENGVWRLGKYGETDLPCVEAVSKSELVRAAMIETRASAVANSSKSLIAP